MPSPLLRFAFIKDPKTRAENLRIVLDHALQDNPFVLLAGDITHSSTPSQWKTVTPVIAPLIASGKLFTTTGGHDVGSEDAMVDGKERRTFNFDHYLSATKLPLHYTFDRTLPDGSIVRFIVANQRTYVEWAKQYYHRKDGISPFYPLQYVDEQLTIADADPKIVQVFVMGGMEIGRWDKAKTKWTAYTVAGDWRGVFLKHKPLIYLQGGSFDGTFEDYEENEYLDLTTRPLVGSRTYAEISVYSQTVIGVRRYDVDKQEYTPLSYWLIDRESNVLKKTTAPVEVTPVEPVKEPEPVEPTPEPVEVERREVIIDDREAQKVGEWKRSSHTLGYHGEGYLHDDNKGKGTKSATFTAQLAQGVYEVFARWTDGANRASDVLYTIHYANGVAVTGANQRKDGGKWNSLGKFSFDTTGSVRISNEGTNGYVIADAVRFVPVGG